MKRFIANALRGLKNVMALGFLIYCVVLLFVVANKAMNAALAHPHESMVLLGVLGLVFVVCLFLDRKISAFIRQYGS